MKCENIQKYQNYSKLWSNASACFSFFNRFMACTVMACYVNHLWLKGFTNSPACLAPAALPAEALVLPQHLMLCMAVAGNVRGCQRGRHSKLQILLKQSQVNELCLWNTIHCNSKGKTLHKHSETHFINKHSPASCGFGEGWACPSEVLKWWSQRTQMFMNCSALKIHKTSLHKPREFIL